MADNKCTIVMYHYVRDLRYTRYPNIKGLDVRDFKRQMQFLKQNYNFVRANDLIAAIYESKPLPENAVWLTFDDGYIDHYDVVFPLLNEMGVEGAFFPPIKAITNHEVLDVNKIHFILSVVADIQTLISDLYRLMDQFRAEYNLETNEYYFLKLAKPYRFDVKEVIFVKRLLQVELPEALRKIITDILFKKYVADDENAFSRELYMNEDQIKCMIRNGMYFGSHGYDHYWLDSLTPDKQAVEIDKSLQFLSTIGVDVNNWVMNYPYGAYNDSLIEIIRARGCKLAVSTRVAVAELSVENAFTLPRLDTNDIPKN